MNWLRVILSFSALCDLSTVLLRDQLHCQTQWPEAALPQPTSPVRVGRVDDENQSVRIRRRQRRQRRRRRKGHRRQGMDVTGSQPGKATS